MSGAPDRYMFVFPGQGSQYRGMGEDLHQEFEAARRVYDQASEALGWDVKELSFRDPDDKIGLTAYTQPVLLTHSIACYEVFRDLTSGAIEPDIVAGHSLGEYSALVAAGSLDLASALKLVSRRGQLMSEHGEGQMTAVPLALGEVRPFAEKHYCGIGGCNLPNQTVVGGYEADLEKFEEALKAEHGNVRLTRLKTEGAFHTYLMVKAATEFRSVLEETEFKTPRCKILSNYTGDFHEPEAAGIRYRLFFQLFHPVRWVWGMQRALEEGVGTIVEFGGGLGGETPAQKRPNLATLIKRTVKAKEGRFGRRDEDTKELDFEANYGAAINVATLRESADLALAMKRIVFDGNADGDRIYLPLKGGIPVAAAAKVAQKVQTLGLGDAVALVGQDEADNAEMLGKVAADAKPPEVIFTRKDASVVVGKDVDGALDQLAGGA